MKQDRELSGSSGPRRIGIFGGAFDPVHTGHLLVAQDALEQLHLHRVIFLLSARPPHKQPLLGFEQRRQMLEAALRPFPSFSLSDLELHQPGTTYTVSVLSQLRARRPDDSFFLLIGADQYQEIETWRRYESLSLFAEVIVLTRPGFRPIRRTLPARLLTVRQIEISSSEIRKRIECNLPISGMVPESVHKLILRHRYYLTIKSNRAFRVVPRSRARAVQSNI
ncbi:MAG: nicotinate-nucleotide adenylyltransferase [candidate division WOR-3 bacterium]